jgi:anti-sigma28 factor (negative regulator of flagellin synthesis)
MSTSRKTSTGSSAPQRAGGKVGRAAHSAAPLEDAKMDFPREDAHPDPYRPQLVARLERAVREGRYRPDPTAVATAIVDRIDALLG